MSNRQPQKPLDDTEEKIAELMSRAFVNSAEMSRLVQCALVQAGDMREAMDKLRAISRRTAEKTPFPEPPPGT